jgi:hypothetical protein
MGIHGKEEIEFKASGVAARLLYNRRASAQNTYHLSNVMLKCAFAAATAVLSLATLSTEDLNRSGVNAR